MDPEERRITGSRPATAATGITSDHGQTFTQHRAADRADVSRRGRRPGAVLDLQQPAGQRDDARPSSDTVERPEATARRDAPARSARCRDTAAGVAGRGGRAAAAAADSAARRGAADAHAWEHDIGGCESGFTLPDSTIRTSSGRAATATRSRARMRRRNARARSARGFTRSTPRRTSSSTAATGRRRWRSIRSITTPSTTAAR